MKIKSFILASLLALTGLGVQANGYLRNFNATNFIVGGQVLTSYPTNQPVGTNSAYGVGISTGQAVSLGNFEHIGIDIRGICVISNTCGLTVALIPSMAANTPQMTFGSNVLSGASSTNLINSDWATPPTFTPYYITVPLNTSATNTWTTNAFDFQTNLVMDTGAQSSFPDANWIGIYQVSNNNMVSSEYITNFQVGANTKLIPTPLISQ